MSDRVLITGASGFVGYHLIKAALNSGFVVFAAVRKSSDIAHLQHLGISYTYLDFNDVDALRADIELNNYTYIVHAAGITKAKTQQEYDGVNAGYTYNLALAASQANVKLKKFVFISSLAAIGPLTVFDELIAADKQPAPVTSYGRSKLLAEQKLAPLSNLPLITLRPTAVYGPRERDLLILFKNINKGIEPYIGNIRQQLSFIYVTDLAAACMAALQSPINHKSYNLSDGLVYERYALANYSAKVLNKKTIKLHIPLGLIRILATVLEITATFTKKAPALNPEKLNELTAANWTCSIENAKTEIGFNPAFDLEKGLTETLNWYKNQNWL